MLRRFMIAAILLCATSANAAEIHMNNGDRLTGTVLSKTATNTNVKTKYGLVNINNADIKKITNDVIAVKPVVAIAPVIVKAPEVKKNKLLNAKVTGNANIGMSLNSGNTDKNAINFDTALKSRWEKQRAELKAEYNRAEESDIKTENNKKLSLSHNYFVAPKWFVESFGSLEQDDIELLDLRSTLALGLGYQAYEQDNLNLKFVAGPAYQKEKFSNGTNEEELIAKWAMDYDQKLFDNSIKIFHNHNLSTPFDDTTAYLFQSKSGIKIPLKKGIVATGQIDFDWDNDPITGTQKDDTKYSLKLGYEW